MVLKGTRIELTLGSNRLSRLNERAQTSDQGSLKKVGHSTSLQLIRVSPNGPTWGLQTVKSIDLAQNIVSVMSLPYFLLIL